MTLLASFLFSLDFQIQVPVAQKGATWSKTLI